MSAPHLAQLQRELGAEVRMFPSVKKALLWYRDFLEGRLRVNRDLADVNTPRSARAADCAAATFAALARCLKREHETDEFHEDGSPRYEDEISAIRYRVSGAMQCWLVAWYEGDGWGDGTWLAEKAGLTRDGFRRRCLRTERVLRERLRYAGLLEDEA